MIIYTAGHGTRQAEELIEILRGHGIERLADIRRFPTSRRNPHLARAQLERALDEAGIRYSWLGDELGGRRNRRPDSRHLALQNPAFQCYADHMDSQIFRDAVDALIAVAGTEKVALLCAETLWWRCHRRLVADALTLHGVDVVHLLSIDEAQRHKLTPAMRADEDGWPIYDVGATLPLPS